MTEPWSEHVKLCICRVFGHRLAADGWCRRCGRNPSLRNPSLPRLDGHDPRVGVVIIMIFIAVLVAILIAFPGAS
jgi:hypothetical protein